MNAYETYNKSYMEGYRLGKIEVSQEVLINLLKERYERIDKKLLYQIKMETDHKYLNELVFVLMKDRDISLEGFKVKMLDVWVVPGDDGG